jgi:uncharacterized cupredoxin-like copper-binding protein
MRKHLGPGMGLLIAIGMLGACSSTPAATSPPATGAVVPIVAKDYAFELPATIKGGLVELSFTNTGQEPHFAGFAKVATGKTFEDVKAALTAPPSTTPPAGPPPFEDTVGFPAADPGASGSLTVNLEAGTYAVFCLIPSPDGIPHAVKGMVAPVTVTAGTDGSLPAAVGTVSATDFAFAQVPALKAGANVVGLRNEGKQLHEINLIELSAGKKMEDVVAWYKAPAGPPPMRSLAGIAIKPGEEGTTRLDLKSGSTYAFICAIPDVLGDFAPHITKGMFSAPIAIP